MSKKWSILILTQPSREEFLKRLMTVLVPQTRKNGPERFNQVEILTRTFDKSMELGENRQALIEKSHAEYINFVDDDDLVPSDYVPTILPLLDGVDYIGYRVQCTVDGQRMAPTFHSLKYGKWSQDAAGYYRDISHINPIRRELALMAKMSGGFGEDERWATALRATGQVRTEHYIDRVMYQYLYRSDKSADLPPPLPAFLPTAYSASDRCPRCGNTAIVPCGHGTGSSKRCTQCGFQF